MANDNGNIKNTFQCPNAFIDAGILAHLSGNEAKILMVAWRKIYGWVEKRKTGQDHISVSQFMKFTGLSKPTVLAGLKELQRFKIIKKARPGTFKGKGTLWELLPCESVDLEGLEKRTLSNSERSKMWCQKRRNANQDTDR